MTCLSVCMCYVLCVLVLMLLALAQVTFWLGQLVKEVCERLGKDKDMVRTLCIAVHLDVW